MKTFSDPLRKRDPNGVSTVVLKGKRKRCRSGWYLRWYDRETRRQGWTYAGEAIEDARTYRRQLQALEARGEPDVKAITFKDAANDFLRWKRASRFPERQGATEPADWKEEPTRWLEEVHRRLDKLASTFAGRTLAEILPADLEGYFAKREGGAKTKNADLLILRQLFRWGLRHHYARRDPTAEMKKWKEPRRAGRTLTRKEEARLLKECSDTYKVSEISGRRNKGSRRGAVTGEAREKWSQTFHPPAWLRPITLLALRTSLRLGNLLALEWRHVDFERRRIWLPGEETKNEGDLDLPLHPEALAQLRALHVKAKALSTIPMRVLEALGPVPERRQVARAFGRAVVRARISPPITFHGLRKVAATRMLQGGADLKTVMAVGGWRDPGTLLRVYAAATEQAKRAAVASL